MQLLNKIDVLAAMCPITCLPHVRTLRCFLQVRKHLEISNFMFHLRHVYPDQLLQVVNACYGTELRDDFREQIDRFAESYRDLNIRVTPKIHAVMHHVREFCTMTNTGLGKWSEQSGEAVHYDFLKIWEHYKRKSTGHDVHAARLCKAVCAYNGRHV